VILFHNEVTFLLLLLVCLVQKFSFIGQPHAKQPLRSSNWGAGNIHLTRLPKPTFTLHHRTGHWKIFLPKSLITPTIDYYHRILHHPGATRLHQSISTHFYFNSMRSAINSFIKACDICQRVKGWFSRAAVGAVPHLLRIRSRTGPHPFRSYVLHIRTYTQL